jgi:hypothetical protein
MSIHQGAFEASIVRTHDIVPSMGSLFTWPPRIPHTQYHLLVQSPSGAPYVVVKRYTDFRALHAAAEESGLLAAIGPALALPVTRQGLVSEQALDRR